VNDEGLKKVGRDRFYIPDVVNWQKVKSFSVLLKKYPQDMGDIGIVDFSLGVDPPVSLNIKAFEALKLKKR